MLPPQISLAVVLYLSYLESLVRTQGSQDSRVIRDVLVVGLLGRTET